MKIKFLKTSVLLISSMCIIYSCKKDKNNDPVTAPEPIPNAEEVITTFKISFKDSATNTTHSYMFKDPDGPGGQSAYYGPSTLLQSDSVIQLNSNSSYYASIVLLDETKSPVDSISKEVKSEGAEHMFFYNHTTSTILQSNNPISIQLNASGIKMTYIDLDQGNPQRGIGLETKWRTGSAAPTKFPLSIVLRHQPGTKDGTYASGETDISVDFKLQIN